jgi:hypothetical protein
VAVEGLQLGQAGPQQLPAVAAVGSAGRVPAAAPRRNRCGLPFSQGLVPVAVRLLGCRPRRRWRAPALAATGPGRPTSSSGAADLPRLARQDLPLGGAERVPFEYHCRNRPLVGRCRNQGLHPPDMRITWDNSPVLIPDPASCRQTFRGSGLVLEKGFRVVPGALFAFNGANGLTLGLEALQLQAPPDQIAHGSFMRDGQGLQLLTLIRGGPEVHQGLAGPLIG